MISVTEAREIANKNGFEQKVQERINEIERRIRKASENGFTSVCAFGNLDHNKSDVDLEVKRRFQKQGFKFKRTGMCGGVPQDTEDILW